MLKQPRNARERRSFLVTPSGSGNFSPAGGAIIRSGFGACGYSTGVYPMSNSGISSFLPFWNFDVSPVEDVAAQQRPLRRVGRRPRVDHRFDRLRLRRDRDAGLRLLPDAESLPPCRTAQGGWRSQSVDAVAVHRPRPPVSQALSEQRDHLARAIQGVSHSARGASAHGATVYRTQPGAGERGGARGEGRGARSPPFQGPGLAADLVRRRPKEVRTSVEPRRQPALKREKANAIELQDLEKLKK